MTARHQSVSFIVLLLLICGAGELAYGQAQNNKDPHTEAIAIINGKKNNNATRDRRAYWFSTLQLGRENLHASEERS